jgi:hypothetical protein
MSTYGHSPYGMSVYGHLQGSPGGIVLPREQLVQRHPSAAVSAPGVMLWASETDLATCQVALLDIVTPGEVEEAHASPEIYWDVEAPSPGFGYEPFGEESFGLPNPQDRPGVYQNLEFGEERFGYGEFGHVATEQYIQHGPTYWSEGYDEDGVYP